MKRKKKKSYYLRPQPNKKFSNIKVEDAEDFSSSKVKARSRAGSTSSKSKMFKSAPIDSKQRFRIPACGDPSTSLSSMSKSSKTKEKQELVQHLQKPKCQRC